MKDFKHSQRELQNLALGDVMKKLKEFKRKVENNIIVKIIKWIMYIIVLMILFVIIVQKVTNNNLSIGGFRMFVIVSESMRGEYDIGDVLISKSASEDEINVGDNITYLGTKSSLKGLIITHKVINKETRDGKTYFITKGLANAVEDPEIEYSQIYGKVVYKFIFLSFLAKLMGNQLSYYILFVVVALIISIEVMTAMFSHDDDEDDEEGDGDRGK